MQRSARNERDRGAILVLVLVATVVMSIIVVAVADYASTNLRYGQVVEARAARLSAAQGALDDTMEQLSLRSSLCTTFAGAAGVDVPFPEQVNGADVSVHCEVIGGSVPPTDGYAIVITGEGAPNNGTPLLDIDNSGEPEIFGPVFLQYPDRTRFKKTTILSEGDIFYPDTPCAEWDPSKPEDLQWQRPAVPPTATNLVFSPSTRGFYCVNRTWDKMFGTGPVDAPELATLPANPGYSLSGSCRVFEPGHYTSLPLGNNNYFMSGNYLFDNLGLVSLQGKVMTMGQVVREGFPAIENTACDAARTGDPDTGGATLYIDGNTHFESRANSGLEISGRLQGMPSGSGGKYIVAVDVISSTLGFTTPLMTSNNGSHKEIAMQGLFWAPYNTLEFETIPSQKAAVLRGGAVVAKFAGTPTPAGEGFLIQVPTSPSATRLLLVSTATDSRGTNVVRAIVDYRPSTGEVAVRSRRVFK